MGRNDTKAHDDKDICGAKTRAGTPCKQKAGWGTNHVGTGRCKLHGGKSTGPKDRAKASISKKKNKNSEKHGLYSRHLPRETLEIMNDITDINPLEILWTNIKMQFASIIRAQKIMFVGDKDDHTTFKTGEQHGMESSGVQYDIHASWDKQASFMNSLSRSMGELRNMLKQYVELSNYDDDRLMEIKRMQSIIDKNNAEVEKMGKDAGTDAPMEITIVDKWADSNED